VEVIQSARMPRSGSASLFSARLISLLATALISFWLSFPEGARADAAGEARAAFERGVEATRAARWQDARREFQRSRDLVVKPSTLFNLAVADVKLGLGQEAIQALDAFQTIATDQHSEMLERAQALRAEAERLMDAAQPAVERARTLIEPAGASVETRRLFQLGHDAYADGDDKLALDSFESAYRLSPRAELLYDIGVVADRMRDDERAVSAFRRFVAVMPDVSEAALARKRIERLEQGLQDRRQTLVVAEENEPLPVAGQPVAQSNLRLPRALVAVGVLLTAGALGSAIWWADRSDKVDACHRPDEVCTNEAQVERQKRSAMGMTLGLGIGGVALMTGGGIWLARQKHAADVAVHASRERFELRARLAF
jgi:tetratricopeptide (TPR) repeat protein